MSNSIEFASQLNSNLKIYSEEVNEHRALPAIEDGLRPSARYLLYCMFKDGLLPSKKYVKCASPIGQTLARYYVHGDSALYGVLTNLSQDWKNNYSLIDFHGGLGTPDAPQESAHMRYTECRLSKYGEALMKDLKYATEWEDNYLNTEKVPKYFISSFPNLLVNPTIGIGWSMACNWLPHKLSDIIKAVKDRKNGATEFSYLAPSFPSGGIIINAKDMANIYKTGRGRVIVRGKYEIKGTQTIFTELPYRVGPAKIIEQLKTLGITAADESTMGKTCLVIDSTNTEVFFKSTSLQESFNVNMTGLIGGKPKLFNLIEILDFYIAQQHKRITNRAAHFAEECRHKILIQEGLYKALLQIDTVIKIIRESDTPSTAKVKLEAFLEINAEQSAAILSMTLSRLTKMELGEVRKEIESFKQQLTEHLETITNAGKRDIIWESEVAEYHERITAFTKLESLIETIPDGSNATAEFCFTKTDKGYIACDSLTAQENNQVCDKTINPNDDIIIVTNQVRGFIRKGSDFKIGEYAWGSILKLNVDEKVLLVLSVQEIEQFEFIEFIEKEPMAMHKSRILLGSTQRGKKLCQGKYNITSFSQQNSTLAKTIK